MDLESFRSLVDANRTLAIFTQRYILDTSIQSWSEDGHDLRYAS